MGLAFTERKGQKQGKENCWQWQKIVSREKEIAFLTISNQFHLFKTIYGNESQVTRKYFEFLTIVLEVPFYYCIRNLYLKFRVDTATKWQLTAVVSRVYSWNQNLSGLLRNSVILAWIIPFYLFFNLLACILSTLWYNFNMFKGKDVFEINQKETLNPWKYSLKNKTQFLLKRHSLAIARNKNK